MWNVDSSPLCFCLCGLLLFLLPARHNTSLLVFALFICALWNSFVGLPCIFASYRVQSNTEWYSVVQSGAEILSGREWYRLVQSGTDWCNTSWDFQEICMKRKTVTGKWCSYAKMEDEGGSVCFSITFQSITWNPTDGACPESLGSTSFFLLLILCYVLKK